MEAARTRLRSSDVITAAGALCVVTVSVVFLVPGDWRVFGAFAALVAAGEMFEVTLPNDRQYSMGLAPALGFAFLAGIDVPAAVTVLACGLTISTAMRAVLREPTRLLDSARRVVVLAAAMSVYYSIAGISVLEPFGNHSPAGGAAGTSISKEGLLVILVTLLFMETLLHAFHQVDRERIPFLPVFVSTLRSTSALHLSILSVGALLALSYPSLDYWAFPLFLAPLAATQFAFRQFASIRKTYLQTIRALSKVPELAGYTARGHSGRVADLSVAIARELGITDQALNEIEYAALLHDIGRVSIPDPAAGEPDRRELAVVGAGIVRETGHFPKVADMIERQHDPYRRRGEDADPDLSAGAKIIKVASAFDDITKPGGIGLNPRDALERLYLGMTYEYDPAVIQALAKVLEKRGTSMEW
ncbi:MAG: HD domain-containing protein [Actinomycetota bacterium]